MLSERSRERSLTMPKRVSIKDVAAEAGVSYQTVSKVLNGQIHVLPETADRVWGAARQLGYRPNHNARNLRTQRSRMIGYSWEPDKPNQTNAILDAFLSSMVEEAEAAGYHLLPFPFRQGENLIDGYRELIDSGRVDGFILSSVNYNDPRAEYLLQRQFPFVSFGRSSPAMDFTYVDVDGAAGLRQATEYLILHGHKRIGALAWPTTSRVGNDRLEGYRLACLAAGLVIDEELVAREEGTFDNARATTERWLALPAERRPTGIVAMTDTQAIGAMQAGQAQGLTIGRDLAIIGFDDSPMAEFLTPALSSVRQPIRAVGRKCVELLIGQLKGEPLADRHVLYRPDLIIRASA